MTNTTLPKGLWAQDIAAATSAAPEWLWQGFLARGNITLLTSLWKSGKTTLISLLLSRRKQGGALAGFPVTPGKSLVVSEESPQLWGERYRRLDFGDNVYLLSQPFRSIPSSNERQDLVDMILQLHESHNLDLVVIDPLALFCLAENQGKGMLDLLLTFAALTSRGLAVLMLHHHACLVMLAFGFLLLEAAGPRRRAQRRCPG
jgi:hypothetical protein